MSKGGFNFDVFMFLELLLQECYLSTKKLLNKYVKYSYIRNKSCSKKNTKSSPTI